MTKKIKNPQIKNSIASISKVLRAINDPIYFVENILKINFKNFEWQRDVLDEFYSNDYKRLILVCGMRAGKSALSAMIALYEFYCMYNINNISEKYNLLPFEPIFILVAATSQDQAGDTVFRKVKSMIQNCEWGKQEIKTGNLLIFKDSIMRSDEMVVMKTVSSWSTTAVGRTCKVVVFDELDLFEETTGKRSAEEMFSRLSKSTATFGKQGKVIAISSPKHTQSLMMRQYRSALNDPYTMAILKPTWELNKNLTEEELRNEFRDDMGTFWRDFACKPELASRMAIPSKLSKSFNRGTPNLIEQMVTNPDISDTTQMRVLALDPAAVRDSFGIAMGWKAVNENIVIDGAWRFKPEKGMYVSPSMIKEFVSDVVDKFGVWMFIYDTWMYPELIEYLQMEKGLVAEKHIVKKEDYDMLVDLDSTDKLFLTNYPVLINEVSSLILKGENRVDRPHRGSKDVADSVANVVWALTSNDLAVDMRMPMHQVITY